MYQAPPDDLTLCKINLKNLGTALEMYASDHQSRYPSRLEQITPEYLRKLPKCPSSGQETYSSSYQVSADSADFSLRCSNKNHSGYSSREGLNP